MCNHVAPVQVAQVLRVEDDLCALWLLLRQPHGLLQHIQLRLQQIRDFRFMNVRLTTSDYQSTPQSHFALEKVVCGRKAGQHDCDRPSVVATTHYCASQCGLQQHQHQHQLTANFRRRST